MSLRRDTHTSAQPHLLAFTDSSSALGWLHHSTFDPVHSKHHDKLARHLAQLLFKHQASLYSEHIAGVSNVTADALSRDFHLTDQQLSNQLFAHAPPSQVPTNFKIVPLPKIISSWIVLQLESMTPSLESPPAPYPSSLKDSGGTVHGSTKNTTTLTHSSTTPPSAKGTSSCVASPSTSVTTCMDQHI